MTELEYKLFRLLVVSRESHGGDIPAVLVLRAIDYLETKAEELGYDLLVYKP